MSDSYLGCDQEWPVEFQIGEGDKDKMDIDQ